MSVLAISAMMPAAAHDRDKMCGPVVDGNGNAVLQSDGDILLHGGSFPCPPEDAEPAAVSPSEPVSSVVYFDFDIDSPNGEGDAALADVLSELLEREPDEVIVAGHADRAGTEDYNQDLSQRRADNIAKSLIAGGVESSAVTIEAFGETRPAVPTEDGVREPGNRRVEIDATF
jgi:outer membrane protein OmpA-like peptidoglycan-associated protein